MKQVMLQLDEYLHRYAQSAARKRGYENAELYLAERLSTLLHAEYDEVLSKWDGDRVFEEDEGGGFRLIDEE